MRVVTNSTATSHGCPVAHVGDYPFPRNDQLSVPPELERLRTEAPISTVTLPSGDTAWLVTRYADVKKVLSHPAMSRDLNRPDAAQMTSKIGSGNYGNPFADAPEHTRWRRKVARAFTPRQVALLRPQVEQIVVDLVDELRAVGQPAELMSTYAYPLPLRVLCSMLGVPESDHPRFRAWVDTILSEEHGAQVRTEAALEVRSYALALADQKRAAPGNDLLSGLATQTDDPLDDDELFVTVMTLLVAGYKTTTAEIAKGVITLSHHRDQVAQLIADPRLAVPAAHELLRLTPPGNGIGLTRYATAALQVGDVLIPQGATVICARHVANRDELRFADAGRLRLTRDNAHQHLTFGAGRAYCFGAPVAEMELELTLLHLFRAFPDLTVNAHVDWQETMATQVPTRLEVSWS